MDIVSPLSRALFAFLLLSQGTVFSFGYSRGNPGAAGGGTSAPALVSAYLGTRGSVNTMAAGGTLQIIAYGVYSDGSVGTLPDAQGNVVTGWNTSNHYVAKIAGKGYATAVSPGTVNMEATIGTIVAIPWTVTVTKAPFNPNAPTLVSVRLGANANANTMVAGGTLQIVAYSTYSDGSTGTLPDAQGNAVSGWNTTNHAVAKISGEGHATGLSAGTVTMEATIGTLVASPWAVTVRPIAAVPPPVAGCSANPSIIHQGGTAVITAAGSSPQNLPLTYSYSASAGSIEGTGTTASLQTSGASAGIVTVTCTVDQQGGGTASATTQVLLQPVTGEQALSNFQFTDSVGVNVHLAYGDTVYASQFPQIMQSMVSLGSQALSRWVESIRPRFSVPECRDAGQGGNQGGLAHGFQQLGQHHQQRLCQCARCDGGIRRPK